MRRGRAVQRGAHPYAPTAPALMALLCNWIQAEIWLRILLSAAVVTTKAMRWQWMRAATSMWRVAALRGGGAHPYAPTAAASMALLCNWIQAEIWPRTLFSAAAVATLRSG